MHRNKEIFPHPMVEYIPLPFYTIEEGRRDTNKKALLLIEKEWERIARISKSKKNPRPEKGLYLLLFNAKVLTIKYRGHTVTVLGEKKGGYYQLGYLTTRYFYKKKLSFLLYTPKGDLLNRNTITIHP